MLLSAIFLGSFFITGDSGPYEVGLNNQMTFGLGMEVLDARNPVERVGPSFYLSWAYSMQTWIDLATTMEFLMAGAGKNGSGSDAKTEMLFGGKLYESVRLGPELFKKAVRPGLDLGVGAYFVRHGQNNNILPQARLVARPMLTAGVVLDWFPLLQSDYRWSTMLIQLKSQYFEYFGSKVVNRGYGLQIGFGGTF